MWLDYSDGWWGFSFENPHVPNCWDISDWGEDIISEFFGLPSDAHRLKYMYMTELRKEYENEN